MRYVNHKTSLSSRFPILQAADIPYELYLSLEGKYFVGYADNMTFGNGTIAWAGLINPIYSGVNLFLYVWTVTNIGELPLTAKVWFNTKPSGEFKKSEFVTPANTALSPLPKPSVQLLEASNVFEKCEGRKNIFVRQVDPEVTIASDEQGKYIFPPGGCFIVTLSYSEALRQPGAGRVAFGWSEEKIIK